MAAETREVAFEAFINGAVGYCQAADALLQLHRTASMSLSPILNAYFIAAELALKAFLRHGGKTTHSLRTKYGHDLNKMYNDAITCGLRPDQADVLDLRNIIGLLQNGNTNQAFRYFIFESRTIPDADWAGKVVNILIDLVRKQTGFALGNPGPAVKIDIVVTQPKIRAAVAEN